MSNCPSLNCANAVATPPPLQPNPDISGIGVLVGFFATAYIAWSLLVIHYILVFDPARAGLNDEITRANPINVKILSFITKYVTRPQKTWEKALEKMVLTMSDQQMIAGIALLSSAFMQLNCGISAYHWQMTIYLVWFSSFTHLATLTFLRQYLHENSPMRWWRLFFMTALLLLLVAALIPTGNDNWLPSDQPDKTGTPALCLFSYPSTEGATASLTMLFSVLILCISYIVRAIKLFKWSSTLSRLYLRTKPGNLVKMHLEKLYWGIQSTETGKWIICVPYYVVLSILLIVRSWLDLLESMFWEVTWLLIALIWGSLRLFSTRNLTIKRDENILDENIWGFGQCLATAMLTLLLFSGIETYIETNQVKRSNRIDSSVFTSHTATSSGADVNSARENEPARASLAENGHMTSTSRDPRASEDADIFDQPLLSAGMDDSLQGITRSATSLSREERSLETVSRSRRHSNQGSESGIELEEATQATPDATEPTTESQTSTPHSRNYYDDRWYCMLALFHFCHVLLLSGGILSGAYEHGFYDHGLFGSARDLHKMFMNLMQWVFVYAPISSFILTIPYVGLKEIQFIRSMCRRAPSKATIWWNILLFPVAICLSVISIAAYNWVFRTLGDRLPFGVHIGFLYIYSILGIIYGTWFWIITRILKRQGGSN